MASRRALWAAEAEMDEDLHEVDINLAIGNYGQNNGQQILYDPEEGRMGGGGMGMVDEATLAAMQHQMAQQAAFAQIPDVVKSFIVHFHQAVLDNNLDKITAAYESGWNRLTEKYYAKTEWPEAELIAPLVNDDQIFLILYRELYYRHVYSRLNPDIDERFHSYENSCELFNYLLNSDGPVPLQLPDQWLWDILDEFIYQFQSFSVWRTKVKTKTEEEVMLLAEGNQQVWSCYSVLNVLYSLIQKSKVNEYIVAVREGKSEEEINEIVGDYGQKPLYRTLGYYSIICLLRVHVLLGDFTLALKNMENIELAQKSPNEPTQRAQAPLTKVTACHVSTYYYVGFCYMALRRYSDATRIFVGILNFISRMRQYHTRSYQYDQVNKTADRMYALFAICHALSPSRLDDNILNIVKEKYGEQLNKMSRGGEDCSSAFEELFLYACPKFILANPPPYEDPEALQIYVADPPQEPAQRHLDIFLEDVRVTHGLVASLTAAAASDDESAHEDKKRAPSANVPTLRSFLKLYASLDAHKLASFLDADEEEMVEMLMVLKQASRSISRVQTTAAAGKDKEGDKGVASLLDGETITTSDLDFVIDENMVHIVESTIGRRYGGWFIRNAEHTQRVLDGIKAAPLPKPKTAQPNGTNKPSESAQPPKAGKTVAWAR